MDIITSSQRWLSDAKSSITFRPTLYGIVWQKVTFNGEVKSLLEVSKISETGRQMGDGEEAPCQNKGVDDMEVDD